MCVALSVCACVCLGFCWIEWTKLKRIKTDSTIVISTSFLRFHRLLSVCLCVSECVCYSNTHSVRTNNTHTCSQIDSTKNSPWLFVFSSLSLSLAASLSLMHTHTFAHTCIQLQYSSWSCFASIFSLTLTCFCFSFLQLLLYVCANVFFSIYFLLACLPISMYLLCVSDRWTKRQKK